MPDPLFESRTARFDLPLLFAGQAQKEVFVNEAIARLDSLLHCVIEAEQSSPPSLAEDGKSWLIGTAPTGDWTGRAGQIATRQGGNWLFITPREGLRVFNKQLARETRFDGEWSYATRPAAPAGGTTVDAEARAAIADLIASLEAVGIFPPASP